MFMIWYVRLGGVDGDPLSACAEVPADMTGLSAPNGGAGLSCSESTEIERASDELEAFRPCPARAGGALRLEMECCEEPDGGALMPLEGDGPCSELSEYFLGRDDMRGLGRVMMGEG